jgi:hypothetical protein
VNDLTSDEKKVFVTWLYPKGNSQNLECRQVPSHMQGLDVHKHASPNPPTQIKTISSPNSRAASLLQETTCEPSHHFTQDLGALGLGLFTSLPLSQVSLALCIILSLHWTPSMYHFSFVNNRLRVKLSL